MIKKVKYLMMLVVILIVSGCTGPTKFYNKLPVGELNGQINLQWRDDPKKSFVYIPNPDDLFSYTTSKGDVITPGALYTDGGSIPRIVSLDKYFVPWKYGPAYIIHDWIFELHDCGQNLDGKYNHVNAAEIMAEVIKTQFVSTGQKPTFRERIAIWEIYGFTKSFSKGIWFSEDAECEVPPDMEIRTEMMDEMEPQNVMGDDDVSIEEVEQLRPDNSKANGNDLDTVIISESEKADAQYSDIEETDTSLDDSGNDQHQAVPYLDYLNDTESDSIENTKSSKIDTSTDGSDKEHNQIMPYTEYLEKTGQVAI